MTLFSLSRHWTTKQWYQRRVRGVAMRLGWILTVFVALLAVFIPPQWYYNHHVRREILSDSTDLMKSEVHVVSVLQRDPSFPNNIDSMVIALINNVSSFSGSITYIGRVVEIAVPSKQFELPNADIVVVTTWRKLSGFIDFRKSLHGWANHRVQIMYRNAWLNHLIPTGLFLLNLKSSLLGPTCNLTETVDDSLLSESTLDHISSRLAIVLESTSKGSEDDAIMIWNWLKNGSPEQIKEDRSYSLKMMEMLSQNGGGLINFGTAVQTSGVETDGEFDFVASVYYPGRAFFHKLLRSRWMKETVAGKQLGDTLAVITIPYLKSAPSVPKNLLLFPKSPDS
eukprot:TRINITY_DN9812_c0_g1_i2.p1 TRINITY_DN9812_c0_g1~~TRINITY_DN9812_c0_g1_i2.p1  ORF type:complete len:339 (-),score=50.45 TRINITY_DN9812_c0_g1_i2:223-1239(-)